MAMRKAVVLLVALLLLAFPVLAQAPTQEEIHEVVGAIVGDIALGGLELATLVVMVVGIIRYFTKLDGRRVILLVFGVSIAAVVAYNVLEGGMPLGSAVLAAISVALTAIGGHQTVGKWLKDLLGVGKAESQTGTG